MSTKVISFRIDTEKFSELQQMAEEEGFGRVSEFLQEATNSILRNKLRVKKQKYPADARSRKLYRIFLEETNGNGGRIEKKNTRLLQLRAGIAQSRTFRTRIEMLKAQGYLTEQKTYFVVLKRWEQ